jgi:hypothetical protein
MSKDLNQLNGLMESLLAKNEDLEEVPSLVPNSTWWGLFVLPNRKVMELLKGEVVTKVCYGSEGLKIRHVAIFTCI